MSTEQPNPPKDPIPWLPFPHWFEEILTQAAKLIVKQLLFRLIGGNPDGSVNIQPTDSRDERQGR